MSSSYYDEDEELDIRIHRGRASPVPVIYPEHRMHRPSVPTRPLYYQHGSSYLDPARSGGPIRRSHSTGRRASPPAAPVIINNRIYNENFEEDDDDRYLPLVRPSRTRSRSRGPSFSGARDEYELERTRRELELYKLEDVREKEHREKDKLERTRRELEQYRLEDVREKEQREREKEKLERTRRELEMYRFDELREKELRDKEKEMRSKEEKRNKESELEKTRKELEAYKHLEEKEREEKRLKQELEFERLRKEKKAAEEKERIKKETEEAIEKYKIKQAEEAAKAKKEKEEREKEYQHRLEDDLRKAGMNDRQIAVVTKKEKAIDPNRPTYTRLSRRHLSIETLNAYRIDYELDTDRDYILIKRWVPEYEQDFLWNHTREIRERRQPVFLALEEKKHKHHETELEFVRKKEHKRKTSPSPLLAYFAGGRP